MSRRKNQSDSGAMLELWRPPYNAGDPIGCIATTYTFNPSLFDEQCLARFLDIDSEPNRESLSFLLERESRLGGVYAGVLIDHTQAGVEHSLRWDVLPVRVPRGKQHAKLSVLVWTQCIRIIVTSANLTDSGYRFNYEVASAVDLTRDNANISMLEDAVDFLRDLLRLVPGASESPPDIERARTFLARVLEQTSEWSQPPRRKTMYQRLVFTTPDTADFPARSSLEEAIDICRKRGRSPRAVWVASPFFDVSKETNSVVVSLCKLMARGERREVCFCVPEIGSDGEKPRLAAPKSLVSTAESYRSSVRVEILPHLDRDKNPRQWHAKMMAFHNDRYSALMIGSSNFTSPGMGIGHNSNTEANLITVVDNVARSKDKSQLEAIWPEMEQVVDPDAAEWLGPQDMLVEEEGAVMAYLPLGFLSATYCAGDSRQISLRLAPSELPSRWRIFALGVGSQELLTVDKWLEMGGESRVDIKWDLLQPPNKLMVQWEDKEAFLSLNVEDQRALPPPAQLENMSADDMLRILAATDPSATFRAWAKQRETESFFDSEMDAANPIDLNPLSRHDIQKTFLHRIRRRARVLAQMRENLQKPVWGQQALEWRLRGLVGVEPLSNRLVQDLINAETATDEVLLALADFLIVLSETDYMPVDGSLTKRQFNEVFQPFLGDLVMNIGQTVNAHNEKISEDLMPFWERVLERCQA